MARTVRDAYLHRLGLDAEPPSVDALFRLHRAHVERVPYETLWIQLGEPWDIGPAASVVRIATAGRGGYCFHLNGAFSELLAALGTCRPTRIRTGSGTSTPGSATRCTNHCR